MDQQTREFLKTHNSIDFQKIKDHPNILIAANFWDPERYDAAKTCYKYMRAIDDLIDNYKANYREIGPNQREEFMAGVEKWLKMVAAPDSSNNLDIELALTIQKFRIPVWPLETFARSMIYDINNDGFPTLRSFLDYTQGASVAPASIFVHLCGIVNKNGIYGAPLFDVKEAATPCAYFSYLVHIIRDFQKDQFNNLNYFADDLIVKYGLSREILRKIADGMTIPDGFRSLIREYYLLAYDYKEKTQNVINRIKHLIEPKYQLSLNIIFELYIMVFERINIEKGNFSALELNPTPEEIQKRVYETIIKFRN